MAILAQPTIATRRLPVQGGVPHRIHGLTKAPMPNKSDFHPKKGGYSRYTGKGGEIDPSTKAPNLHRRVSCESLLSGCHAVRTSFAALCGLRLCVCHAGPPRRGDRAPRRIRPRDESGGLSRPNPHLRGERLR